MIYLADTNIWLERLLQQDRANEVEQFFSVIPSDKIAISDFALHSIGVILSHLKKPEVFFSFITDVFGRGDVQMVSLNASEHLELSKPLKELALDFDDAYQYLIANKYQLTLVTFDKDFNKADIPVMGPLEALQDFKKRL